MNTLHFKLLRARHSSTRMFHLFMHMNFQLLHLVTRIFLLQFPHHWIIFWCLFHLAHLTSSKHGKFIEIANSLSAICQRSWYWFCFPLPQCSVHKHYACTYSFSLSLLRILDKSTTQHAFNPTYALNTYFVLVFYYIP